MSSIPLQHHPQLHGQTTVIAQEKRLCYGKKKSMMNADNSPTDGESLQLPFRYFLQGWAIYQKAVPVFTQQPLPFELRKYATDSLHGQPQ